MKTDICLQMFQIVGSSLSNPTFSETLTRFTTNPNNGDFQWLMGCIEAEDSSLQVGKRALCLAVARLFDSTLKFDMMASLGTGWLLSGMIMVHLYVPNFPLDPQAVAFSQRQRLETQIKELDDELILHQQMELIWSGGPENPLISRLKHRLERLKKELGLQAPSMSRQRNEATLRALSAELIQFHQQFVDFEHMNGLVAQLINNNEKGAMAEEMTQESWRHFIKRIDGNYPDLGDIIDPFVTWLNRMRLGLSLLRHSSKPYSDIETRSSTMCRALTSFPHSVGARTLSHGNIHPPLHVTPAEWATIRLYSSLWGIQEGEPLDFHRSCLSKSFEQLFGCWYLERTKKEEEEKDKASIYKSRKEASTVLSDQEIEAAEFLELFPEYIDVLDERDNQVQDSSLASKISSPYQMFLQLPFLGPSTPRISDAVSQTTLVGLINRVQEGLDTNLDEETIQYRLNALQGSLNRLEMVPSLSKAYNFYVDSNIPEMIKALKIVSDLCDRLTLLIERWPEHMVLQHLLERCQAIKKIDMYSSVARMLSAIEQLLLQTEDWQKFVDRENTILTHQQDLSNLIVEWRRMELVCWTRLLDNEASSFSNDLSDWWFRLYEIIVHTTHQAMDTAIEQTTFLENLLPLLERYLAASPIGQYSTRLDLLSMFEKYLLNVAYSPSARTPFERRLSTILGSVIATYQRFRPTVEATLKSRRETIDNEIKSFVQIASWKDINVLALKASAQRTHHQLHKSIRKFRALLAEPVGPLLSSHPIEGPPSTVVRARPPQIESPSVVPELGLEIPLPRHLRDLNNTLRLFHAVTCESSKPLFSLPSQQVEEISALILTTIVQFQNDTAPSGVKNKKGWLANLLNQKRKALADLFKACKGYGLPSRVKPDVQNQHSSRIWLLEHRSVISRTSPTLDRMDSYVDRILTSLPKLQMSLASHSEDISTRDLSKLLCFVQGALQPAFEARIQSVNNSHLSGKSALTITYRLYEAVDIYNQIMHLVQSLEMEGKDLSLIATGDRAQEFILGCTSLICYSISSAREIVQTALNCPKHGVGAKPFGDSILSDINQCINALISKRELFMRALSRNSGSNTSLLFSCEYIATIQSGITDHTKMKK
jgi:midasin